MLQPCSYIHSLGQFKAEGSNPAQHFNAYLELQNLHFTVCVAMMEICKIGGGEKGREREREGEIVRCGCDHFAQKCAENLIMVNQPLVAWR